MSVQEPELVMPRNIAKGMMSVFLSASIVLSPLPSIAMSSPPIIKIAAAAAKPDAKKADAKKTEAPAPAAAGGGEKKAEGGDKKKEPEKEEKPILDRIYSTLLCNEACQETKANQFSSSLPFEVKGMKLGKGAGEGSALERLRFPNLLAVFDKKPEPLKKDAPKKEEVKAEKKEEKKEEKNFLLLSLLRSKV